MGPRAELNALSDSDPPKSRKGRPLFDLQAMPSGHFMQRQFTLSDLAMELALHDELRFREFP